VAETKKTGVARALSKLGYCSRSQAVSLVRAGRVALGGRTVRDPHTPVPIGHHPIFVDGVEIVGQAKIYLIMNKPRGVVTTASDEQGRATVYDLLEPGGPWVGPVGRLDKASEGLLLLTNDSEWAAKITDPASHLDKVYHVQVDCLATDDLLERLKQGVMLEGGRLRTKSVRKLRQGGRNSWLEITLDEGKNRHIRRMMQALGLEVLRLVRIAIGPLELGDLQKGSVRSLTAEEKEQMDMGLAQRKRFQKTTGACR
jgi:23S rRNA pseudouridine2605 synthase